ncbi:MAG: LON peptidase substrate-binding domain-containing protein [Acidobacteria bacterium]|nr:LON peptidase substrate-binding domain-containing protein [Acidobacteriota bacterium]
MPITRIPLFPLEVVLLPEAVLPLHIFEPRYREMVRICMNESQEFGVVRQQDESVVSIGCTAEITQVLKRYDDGRLDILCVGRKPFRISSLVEEKVYQEADVEFLDDKVSGSLAGQTTLLKKYGEIHSLLFAQEPPEMDLENVDSVAYAIAAELPFDLDTKQVLLETRSEAERRQFLLERIERWIPVAAHQQRIKKSAGGNGHGLH